MELNCSNDDSYLMPTQLGSSADPVLVNYGFSFIINNGFTLITKLNLKLSYTATIYTEMFIERSLACSANLFTFLLDFEFGNPNNHLLDSVWWQQTFAWNKKLRRISLQLHYRTDDLMNYPCEDEVIERFLLSAYFAQLNVTVSCEEGGNSEYLELHYFIKNCEN